MGTCRKKRILYQGLAAGQTAWPMRQYAENNCIQNCKESRREERKNCRINGCIHVVLLGGGMVLVGSRVSIIHFHPFSDTCEHYYTVVSICL